jgi:multicomponent Na+:H+ antiporter subunit C
MNLVLMVTISLIVAGGVLLTLSRDLIRLVVGLAILSSAVNLIVFLCGRPGSSIPPVIEAGASDLPPGATSSLPQALLLTAIVIGFALLCFALVLGATIVWRSGTEDVDHMQASEPPATDPMKPPVLED